MRLRGIRVVTASNIIRQCVVCGVWSLRQDTRRPHKWGHCGVRCGGRQGGHWITDASARVWNVDFGECLQTLKGHTDWVTAVCPMSGGRVVTGSDDETARVWDVASGKLLQTLLNCTQRYMECALWVVPGLSQHHATTQLVCGTSRLVANSPRSRSMPRSQPSAVASRELASVCFLLVWTMVRFSSFVSKVHNRHLRPRIQDTRPTSELAPASIPRVHPTRERPAAPIARPMPDPGELGQRHIHPAADQPAPPQAPGPRTPRLASGS